MSVNQFEHFAAAWAQSRGIPLAPVPLRTVFPRLGSAAGVAPAAGQPIGTADPQTVLAAGATKVNLLRYNMLYRTLPNSVMTRGGHETVAKTLGALSSFAISRGQTENAPTPGNYQAGSGTWEGDQIAQYNGTFLHYTFFPVVFTTTIEEIQEMVPNPNAAG